MTGSAVSNNIERIQGVIERLNELGGRLIGIDQLPRNQRERATDDRSGTSPPEPVRSESEQVNHQLQRMSLEIDELQEIVSFLEQL